MGNFIVTGSLWSDSHMVVHSDKRNWVSFGFWECNRIFMVFDKVLRTWGDELNIDVRDLWSRGEFYGQGSYLASGLLMVYWFYFADGGLWFSWMGCFWLQYSSY